MSFKTIFDENYSQLISRIINEGKTEISTSSHYDDTKEPALRRSIKGCTLYYGSGDTALLTVTKKVGKGPLKELSWIWQDRSNVVQDLRDKGSKIWDQWELEDGTIGKAYGYVLGQRVFQADDVNVNLLSKDRKEEILQLRENKQPIMLDTVEYLLYQMDQNIHSNYLIFSLWDIHNLQQMRLKPCVWTGQFYATKGIPLNEQQELNLDLHIRSNDIGLGHVFNIHQYKVLLSAFAHIFNLKVGELNVHIVDAHLYDRHIPIAEESMRNALENQDPNQKEPMLVWKKKPTNFFEIDFINDLEVTNIPDNLPVVKYPISVS